jgi:hypothetical protein
VDRSSVTVLPTTFDGMFQVYLHRNVERVQSRFMQLLAAALRDELIAFCGSQPREPGAISTQTPARV